VVATLGAPLPVATPRQVHGTRVVIASAVGAPGEADAILSDARGLLVGVVTADCVPVLLVARRRRVVAAVHAGWRGAAAGVLEAAVGQLDATYGVGPAEIEAVIGPAVGGCCYEVGPEVAETFRRRTDRATDAAWSPRSDRWLLDLRLAARLLLTAAGVPVTSVLGPCTVCDPGYHSYRRDGRGAGRQLSFVGWA
jgi:YfiH family protein